MRIKKIELIKLRNEITSDIKPLNTTKDIISWYKSDLYQVIVQSIHLSESYSRTSMLPPYI